MRSNKAFRQPTGTPQSPLPQRHMTREGVNVLKFHLCLASETDRMSVATSTLSDFKVNGSRPAESTEIIERDI